MNSRKTWLLRFHLICFATCFGIDFELLWASPSGIIFMLSIAIDYQMNFRMVLVCCLLIFSIKNWVGFCVGASSFSLLVSTTICYYTSVALWIILVPFWLHFNRFGHPVAQCWSLSAPCQIYFDICFHQHPPFRHPKLQKAPAANR